MSEKQDEKLSDDIAEDQNENQSEEETGIDFSAITDAEKEAAEWKDKYLRAHADFENTKKRLAKDKSAAIAYSNEKFATDILAVMDSFDQALASIESVTEENSADMVKKMHEGVTLTYEQLKKVLEKNSIKEIDNEGEYDPNLHQAIMQVESDAHEDGQIVQVMQKGYTIKDRVLRPSMVSTKK